MKSYRPSRFTRIAQTLVLITGAILATLVTGIGVYLAKYGLFFTLISLVVSGFLLWFLCRRSYETAFKHQITLTDKGISWRYLGVTGYAAWESVEFFGTDDENGWINMTFATSENRHAYIRVGSFQTNVNLKPYEVWGIRLSEDAMLSKTWLSNLPYESRDFIPITLITNIPLNRDKSINLEKFKETEFGQDLYHYAPHLFEEYDE